MTKTYCTLQRGQFHDHFCEDFYITSQIDTHLQVIAVMDGCSMATESTFASMLFGKLLRRIARDQYFQARYDQQEGNLKDTLKSVLQQLFHDLKSFKNQLGLDTHELLCTLNIGIVDKDKMAAECLVIGDGIVYHDGLLHDFQQADRPDYLAYHLGEPFEDWYKNQTQSISIKSFTDLSLATDGIFTFRPQKKDGEQLEQALLDHFILKDLEGCEQNNFLDRKMRFISTEWNHQATDDLALIRVLKSESNRYQ